jgi:hypothetical protein
MGNAEPKTIHTVNQCGSWLDASLLLGTTTPAAAARSSRLLSCCIRTFWSKSSRYCGITCGAVPSSPATGAAVAGRAVGGPAAAAAAAVHPFFGKQCSCTAGCAQQHALHSALLWTPAVIHTADTLAFVSSVTVFKKPFFAAPDTVTGVRETRRAPHPTRKS